MTNPALTAKITAAVAASGMTVEAIAAAGGLDLNRLAHFLQGTRIASALEIRKLEKALGIPRRSDWFADPAPAPAPSPAAPHNPLTWPVPLQPQVPGFPGLSDRLRAIRGPRSTAAFSRLMSWEWDQCHFLEGQPRMPTAQDLFLYAEAGQVTVPWILFGIQPLVSYQPIQQLLLKSAFRAMDAHLAAVAADRKADWFEAARQRAAQAVWEKVYFQLHFGISTTARLAALGVVPDCRALLCRLLQLDPATATDTAIIAALPPAPQTNTNQP